MCEIDRNPRIIQAVILILFQYRRNRHTPYIYGNDYTYIYDGARPTLYERHSRFPVRDIHLDNNTRKKYVYESMTLLRLRQLTTM